MDSLPGSLPKKRAGLDTQVRKAQVRSLLFKKSSALPKIDRFTLLDLIGVGGMGEVYAAYDERLDRKVAIKLVRGGNNANSRASERLLREAHTLARLSHPNVVQVYDAGRFEDRVYLAIEFIRGQALPDWLTALKATSQQARQRAVLKQLIAAGRGIQAAHQAGLTHRDIKPRNIVVGDDGRARVLDFGLASEQRSDREPNSDEHTHQTASTGSRSVVDTLSASLSPSVATIEQITPEGAIMGTPAYMAPELFNGREASAHSDQFSFCVTAYEALCGERPYESTSIEALDDGSLDVQALAAKSRTLGFPAPIRKALLRGMAIEPEQRYPDMGHLLAALAAWPSKRYRIWLLIAALVVALGISSFLAMRSPTATPVCQGAENAFAGVWDQRRRAHLKSVLLGTGRVFAKETWQLADRELQRYSDSWKIMHRDACLANREGRQSDTMLDRRMACLERRRDALRTTLAVLDELDRESLDKATELIGGLPPLNYCEDVEALSADVPPPDKPEIAEQVRTLRTELVRVRTLEQAGRYAEARELAIRTTERARPLDYLPLLAEAELMQGYAIIKGEDTELRKRAIQPLSEAVQHGFQSGDYAVAMEAFARLTYARSTLEKVDRPAIDLVAALVPLAENLPNGRHALALLHNSIGIAYRNLQQIDQARSHFESARDIATGFIQPMELTASENLAFATADSGVRLKLLNDVHERLVQAYGRGHPRILRYRIRAASYIDNPRLAHDTLAPACVALGGKEYNNDDTLVRCLLLLGFLAAELGDVESGAKHLRALLAPAATIEDYRVPGMLAVGYAELYDDRPKRALLAFAEAREQLPAPIKSFWDKADQAESYLGTGVSEQALGRHEQAIAALERALPVYRRLSERQLSSVYGHRLAWIRLALARSLLARGTERARSVQIDKGVGDIRARAVDLLDAAELWYRHAEHERRLREVQALRRANQL